MWLALGVCHSSGRGLWEVVSVATYVCLSVRSCLCVSMALHDVTNTIGRYVPQIQLDQKYAPLIRQGKCLEGQASRASFPERRAAGETHIDLWIDGCLYPADPATKSPPCFSTTKEYLEFLCRGEGGMLGYTKRLEAGVSESGGQSMQGLENCILTLQSKVLNYEQDIKHLR